MAQQDGTRNRFKQQNAVQIRPMILPFKINSEDNKQNVNSGGRCLAKRWSNILDEI